jgi:hypothetical protein
MSDIDKSAWGPGPWQSEPDRAEWRAHGLPCLIRRSAAFGNWCGYVGVPAGHSWHGKSIDDLGDLDVHGGPTYAEACDGDPIDGVCHAPRAGEPEHAWWIGFDCGHIGDLPPAMRARERSRGWSPIDPSETYKDEAYVRAEVEALAAAASAILETP